jgi:hypothetical protein
LSICKYCAVVSLDATIDDWFADLFKDIILAFILICNKVKRELISFFSVKYHDLVIQYLPDAPALLQALFTLQDLVASIDCMVSSGQRSNPNDHLHVLSFSLHFITIEF